MKPKNANEFADALASAGFRVFSYSGRFMYGRTCVAVSLRSTADLVDVGASLGKGAPAPSTDSLGLGVVAYWPGIKWPDGRPDSEAAAEDD